MITATFILSYCFFIFYTYIIEMFSFLQYHQTTSASFNLVISNFMVFLRLHRIDELNLCFGLGFRVREISCCLIWFHYLFRFLRFFHISSKAISYFTCMSTEVVLFIIFKNFFIFTSPQIIWYKTFVICGFWHSFWLNIFDARLDLRDRWCFLILELL